MGKLIAAEDLRLADFLTLDGEAFVDGDEVVCRVINLRLGHTPPDCIGLAARDIHEGERLEWKPDGNTKDIVTMGTVFTPTETLRSVFGGELTVELPRRVVPESIKIIPTDPR